MDAPFESARSTTAYRLLDDRGTSAATDIKVFAYEGAVMQTVFDAAAACQRGARPLGRRGEPPPAEGRDRAP